MKPIIRLELPEKCRIIAVSDIHTCDYLLIDVLQKAEYKPGEDFLIIVGDILEHWDNNLSTIRTVMELCKNDRVYCLLGNNDTGVIRMAFTYPYKRFQEKFYWEGTTYNQMAKSLGFDWCSEENWLDIRAAVYEKYKAELDFMNSRPIAVETQEHIFVHAGLENRPDWENTDNDYAITVPWFLNMENPTDKWLIVGHFPTYNFEASRCTNLPIFDHDKKIIDIDGGLTIKRNCQLNALVINKNGGEYSYDVVWDTFFKKVKVIADYKSEFSPVYTDWSDQDIEALSIDNGLAFVCDNKTGKTGYIPKSKVYDVKENKQIWDFLSAFPPVSKGELVYYVEDSDGYARIIKKSGEVGWISEKYLERSGD